MSPFSFLANIYAGRLIRPERHGLKHQGFLGVGYAQPKEALLRGHSMRTNPAENRSKFWCEISFHLKYMNQDFVIVDYAQ